MTGSDDKTERIVPEPDLSISMGSILGDRYRVESKLGSGGMGDVWRAFDLKLRVDCALKTLRVEFCRDEKYRNLLRKEVRSARDVHSPNVCRIFDLIEIDGQEMLSMEYIDGTTLLEILQSRGPLDLAEASGIASQFLAGLDAIHGAGLVHRDVKPENIMITRAGRVVVMDFGIAKARPDGDRLARTATVTERGGTRLASIAGTPAYMAPEQIRGEDLDARADVFSVGVVLAEMVAPGGTRDYKARDAIWKAVRCEPMELPDGPWNPVIARAVAHDRGRRYTTARALSRALEEISLRSSDSDGIVPYPGLATFTEERAQFFFGREAEVESVWKKIRQQMLMAIIGPSGAGKSSFLRAGLVPAKPPGWRYLICTPGSAPFRSLAHALGPEFAGDSASMLKLLDIEILDIAVRLASTWRRRHEQVLLFVDQFEELFTLNPREVQEEFGALLGRLAMEADVHVVVSMRDDFFLACHGIPAFAPLFSEPTPMDPPVGAALRRALVQPALLCGYRFEDDALVDEMLAEVEGERGALPLLAFAAAQLWERRDQQRGMITREAYEAIGGVSGALARHAEQTLERIGRDQLDTVREILRNLVTSERTRAARTRSELLSVFEDREAAANALQELIDARLLTSYETEEDREEGEVDDDLGSHQHIEIVHESLLTSWPRLVRWQTQDADGAQLRDELRQAAQQWESHGRTDDVLWSGTRYKEFALWQERYPGGLSELEESFAKAMAARAKRHQRRRRIAVSATFVALLAVLAVVTKLKFDADEASRLAQETTRRTEAMRFKELGRDLLDTDATMALSCALASLERVDDVQTRVLAMEALWKRPTRFYPPRMMELVPGWSAVFSPDGEHLIAGTRESGLAIWPSDGGEPQVVKGTSVGNTIPTYFSPDGSCFLTYSTWNPSGSMGDTQTIDVWSYPGLEVVDSFVEAIDGNLPIPGRFDADGNGFLVDIQRGIKHIGTERWSLDGARRVSLGLPGSNQAIQRLFPASADGRWLANWDGNDVYVSRIEDDHFGPNTRVGSHGNEVKGIGIDAEGELIGSIASTELRVWSARHPGSVLFNAEVSAIHAEFDRRRGRLFSALNEAELSILFDFRGPVAASPQRLEPRIVYPGGWVTHPSRDWLVIPKMLNWGHVSLYPMRSVLPFVVELGSEAKGDGEGKGILSPDSRFVAMTHSGRIWSINLHSLELSRRLIWESPENKLIWTTRFDAAGERLVVGTFVSGAWIVPLEGGTATPLEGSPIMATAVAFSPSGRLVACGGGWGDMMPDDAVLRVWDLETGEMKEFDAGDGKWLRRIEFLSESSVLASCTGGLRIWDLKKGTSRLLAEATAFEKSTVSESWIIAQSWEGVVLIDRSTLEKRDLPLPNPSAVSALAISPDESFVVVGYNGGRVCVLHLDQEQPHYLVGQDAQITDLSIDAHGRWITALSANGELRYWPVPMGRPLFDRPPEEFLAVAGAQTNLRVVVDPESADGYRWTTSQFPGWRTVPTWQEWASDEYMEDPPWKSIQDHMEEVMGEGL